MERVGTYHGEDQTPKGELEREHALTCGDLNCKEDEDEPHGGDAPKSKGENQADDVHDRSNHRVAQ